MYHFVVAPVYRHSKHTAADAIFASLLSVDVLRFLRPSGGILMSAYCPALISLAGDDAAAAHFVRAGLPPNISGVACHP